MIPSNFSTDCCIEVYPFGHTKRSYFRDTAILLTDVMDSRFTRIQQTIRSKYGILKDASRCQIGDFKLDLGIKSHNDSGFNALMPVHELRGTRVWAFGSIAGFVEQTQIPTQAPFDQVLAQFKQAIEKGCKGEFEMQDKPPKIIGRSIVVTADASCTTAEKASFIALLFHRIDDAIYTYSFDIERNKRDAAIARRDQLLTVISSLLSTQAEQPAP